MYALCYWTYRVRTVLLDILVVRCVMIMKGWLSVHCVHCVTGHIGSALCYRTYLVCTVLPDVSGVRYVTGHIGCVPCYNNERIAVI